MSFILPAEGLKLFLRTWSVGMVSRFDCSNETIYSVYSAVMPGGHAR